MKPRLLALTAWLALGAAAWAEDAPLTPAQQAALACMTPDAAGRAALKYPEKPLEYADGGTVTVDLTFSAPGRAPRIEILPQPRGKAVWPEMEHAVRQHVETFRVPCLPADSPPVTVRQEFVFRVDDEPRKVAGNNVEMESRPDTPAARWGHCLTHVDPKATLEYYDRERERELQDSVVLRLAFTDPEQPPDITELASQHTPMARRTLAYAQGLRLPCLPPGERVSLVRIYQFRLLGGDRVFLRDMALVPFLSQAKDIPSARFNLNDMACPFEVRLTYRQPTLPNHVAQLGTSDARREPLLQWLTTLTLKLPKQQQMLAFDQSMVLSIPCGSIDL